MRQTLAQRTADTVRAELARRRLTGADLARACRWSVHKVSRRLNGKQPFDVEELAQVAAILGVSVADLLPPPERDAA